MVKLLKIATLDKFPEVRAGAATLASFLAPLAIHTVIKSPKNPDAPAATPTASLEDIMTLAFKNLDDESPDVAAGWAEALARCVSTSIEYHKQVSAEKTSQRDVEGVVEIELYKGNCMIRGRHSPKSLYNADLASMDIEGGVGVRRQMHRSDGGMYMVVYSETQTERARGKAQSTGRPRRMQEIRHGRGL